MQSVPSPLDVVPPSSIAPFHRVWPPSTISFLTVLGGHTLVLCLKEILCQTAQSALVYLARSRQLLTLVQILTSAYSVKMPQLN